MSSKTTAHSFGLPHKIHTLGAAELAALKQSGDRDTTKILNLREALAARVQAETEGKPFLVNIGERAEALVEAYEDRRKTTQEALKAFEELAQEVVQAAEERTDLGLDENAYAIYSVLRPLVPAITSAQAQEINALFGSLPDYAWDAGQGRQLRTALYKTLRPLVGKQMTDVANTLMRLRRV